jgi:hypothetical protein
MRVIKFRGLRTDGGGWVYGYFLKQNGRGVDGSKDVDICFILDSFGTQIVHPETVGQFTGLLDKNGVEIYEHDKLDNDEVVTWSIEQGCYFAGHSPLCMSASHREVIGNIHELTT